MPKVCRQCRKSFEINLKAQDFYQMMKVPEPTLCYFCRMIRRLSYRNERFLYNRLCDLTGKQIISSLSAEPVLGRNASKFSVYDIDAWWSDAWDAKKFGRNYDFSKSFFEQFFVLQAVVPRLALQQQRPMENSAYCNAASRNKNCYLVFSTNFCEDCYYGSWINYSRDCIDNTNIQNCELCYECIYCRNCYRCFFSQEARNCQDSFFIKNCSGCKDCFMSANLVQKQYYIFNKPYSKEDYFKKLKTYDLGSRKVINELKEQFKKMCDQMGVKYYVGVNNENSTGNYLNNTKNCQSCFEIDDGEDATYSMNINKAKNVMDYSYWGENAERIYESQACGYNVNNLRFCNLCWDGCSDLTYCDHCFSSKNCFGCIGLKNASYCILNKQYSKKDYEELVPRIIQQMKSAGSALDKSCLGNPTFSDEAFGEFFPTAKSIFAYNETLAFEQLPLTKDKVLELGWQWRERNQEYDYQGPQVIIPDNIKNVSPDSTGKIFTCTATGKHYKIIPQELKFYQQQNLSLPEKCPDQRHYDRLALRNRRILYSRNCTKCAVSIQTTYTPEQPESVFCEKCYLAEVY